MLFFTGLLIFFFPLEILATFFYNYNLDRPLGDLYKISGFTKESGFNTTIKSTNLTIYTGFNSTPYYQETIEVPYPQNKETLNERFFYFSLFKGGSYLMIPTVDDTIMQTISAWWQAANITIKQASVTCEYCTEEANQPNITAGVGQVKFGSAEIGTRGIGRTTIILYPEYA